MLHLSFSLPSGNDGSQGPPGNDGSPGEVTYATLNEAIAGTARSPATVAPLAIAVGDPPVQAVANKLDELIGALSRAPVQAGR